MKVKAKSFEAWKVIMITLVFLSYCVGMMPGEKAQAVYDKYLDNGIFGMAFFFVLVGFGIGIHYHKKFINLNKKNYLEFLGKKLGILYPLYMIMQTVFLILALCSHPGSQEIKTLIVKYIISIPMLQTMIPKAGYYMALNPVSWFVSAIFLIYLLAPVIGMLAARMKRDLKRSGLVIAGLIVVYIIVAGPLADAMVLKQDMPYLFLMNLILFCIGVWLANFRLNIRIETDRSAGRNLLTGAELVVLVAAVLIYLGTVGKYGIPAALLRLLLYVLIVMVFSYDGGMISHIFTLSPFGILSSMVFDFYLTQYFVIRYIGTPIQKRFGDSGKDAGSDIGKPGNHFGQGKNSWLTGTAAWNMVAISQYILGISADFDGLKIDPSIPAAWDGLNATRQFRGATYDIKVTNPDHVNKGIKSVTVDGNAIESNVLPVFGDGKTHAVEVVMG